MKFQMTASLFVVILVFSAIIFEGVEASPTIHPVPACDEVCNRSFAEQDSCCRAHGYAGGTCSSFTKILCRR